MSELMSKLDGEAVIGLAAVLGSFVVGIVAILGYSWQKVRRSETDAALKQDMLNRGMTAEQICAVLDAGGAK
ncbi:MAG: hypothetical protein ACJ8C4_05260 [Gemmataceae bacterium]